jgi:DNA-binding CsgD family transcriptional regulator/PAS domain-containing protein
MSGGPAPTDAEFLDLLYGAVADPSLWVAAMERFADMIGGTSAWLSQLDLRDGRGGGIIARIDPAMPELYLRHFAARNPLSNVADPAAYARGWSHRILTDEDWMPKAELLATEYYNDFLAPQDIHSTLMIRLALRGEQICALNVNRPSSRGQYGAAEIERAQAFHGHLIRAFDLASRLAADHHLSADAAALFDRSSHALFLVDAAARTLRLNQAAEALLRARLGLSIAGGRLTAEAPASARRLEALIGSAALAVGDAGGAVAVHSRGRRMPLSVMVAPASGGIFSAGLGGRRVLVCATDLEASASPSEQRLAELFCLTPAEARVAVALSTGANAKEAAAMLGISPNTVHIHLARILSKTGARRQSELMRLMLRAGGLGLF